MADTLETRPIRDRDIYYYRQRNKNRVFERLVSFFAEEAARTGRTKKDIAEMLNRDPSQITRWLSAPNNLTLDSISDLLLALNAEMDYDVAKFEDRARPNYTHPLMPMLNDPARKETNRFDVITTSSPTSGTINKTPTPAVITTTAVTAVSR